MNSHAKLFAVFCLLITCFCGRLQRASADTIHRMMQSRIPEIIEYLHSRDLRTVGVLKFRIKKPGQKTSDSVGPLNSLLADRLEVGLILGNPFQEDRQLNIIKQASDQVAGVSAASHLSDEGRAALFGPEYRLAWGDEKLPADAFLTGVVQVHDDNKRCTVGILCFSRDGSGIERACANFEADLDAAALSELGESYLLRGALSGSVTFGLEDVARISNLTFLEIQRRKQEAARQEAARVKDGSADFPLEEKQLPIGLAVLYDGQPVSLEFRDGGAFLPEPQEGQRVEIVLLRGEAGDARLGVVLKVNGENTLYRQTRRDLDCAKWILSPEHTETWVRGYQMPDGETREAFTVLSREESAARAMDYGRNVGQIQLTVFQELSGPAPEPELVDPEDEDLAAMLRGTQPDEQPQNADALRRQIRTAGREGSQTRGLIVQGEQQQSKIRPVTFTPDPTPIMSVTLTYYTP